MAGGTSVSLEWSFSSEFEILMPEKTVINSLH